MRLQVRERNESPVLGDAGCPCCYRLPRGTSALGQKQKWRRSARDFCFAPINGHREAQIEINER
jgi:hypothetical protein